MAKRFPKITLIIFATMFILTGTKIYSQNNDGLNIGRQIVTQKEIELSGVSRLSDIYSLLNEWNAATIDGYRWQIFSSKTNFNQSQNWILMLDGQRIDLNFFDMKNINFLPLSSWNIDSVEAISSAQLYGGEFTDGGLINISTSKPAKGFSFHAQFFTGNESGDPGPYKYVDKYYSENIDIIGPDYTFGFEYGSDFINASINYKTNAYIYPTSDTPVSYRLTDYDFKYRKVYMDAVSMLLDFPNLISRPKLIAAYSGTGKYDLVSNYGSDLSFYNPLFYEVPVDSKFKHIGLSGSFNLGETSSLDYNTKWSSSKAKNPDDYSAYLIDWRMDNFYFSTQFNSTGKFFNYKLGTSFDNYSATTPYKLKDNNINLYKLFGSLDMFFSPGTKQSAEFMILNNGSKTAFKSSLKSYFTAGSRSKFESRISFSEQLFCEDNNIFYWTAQGYKTPESANWITGNITSNKSTNISAEAAWLYNLCENINLRLSFFFNRFTNMIYEDEKINYDSANKTLSASSQLISDVDGNTFGFSFRADQKISADLAHNLFYEYCSETGSVQLYKDLWDIFPEHKLRYNAYYSASNDFGFRFAITLMSPSKWRDFYSTEVVSEGIYKSKQKSRILCDFSLQKLFWEKRLRINATFKNLFNQKNRYSPVGAYFDFTFFLIAELAI